MNKDSKVAGPVGATPILGGPILEAPILEAPILEAKDYGAPSAFTPENLLREARRQKAVSGDPVPDICVLDPDGDIARHMQRAGRALRHAGWACYHTDLFTVEQDGLSLGIVPRAVGASFAVVVAEQLFASGCRLLSSITSSGQLAPAKTLPYFILIEKALRDEGTSYHYLPPAAFAEAPDGLIGRLAGAYDTIRAPVRRGAVWTTDAPYRETESALAAMRARGLLAVEMEAAALYAFARARHRQVVCFALVTNQMGLVEGDFEKGPADGSADALAVVVATAKRLLG